MTIRIAQYLGMEKVAEIANRTGVMENMPNVLSMALGAGETSLIKLTSAYASFANGGKKIKASLIDRIQDRRGKNIFILDDLFQHRWVKPNIMILLTEYSKPYFKDHLFPSGNLRESRKSSSRADIIIVTKCPTELSVDQKEKFISELNVNLKQKVFFSFPSVAPRL
mgnify:CR=1 FL=1